MGAEITTRPKDSSDSRHVAMNDIEGRLRQILDQSHPFPLIGCPRRNRWSGCQAYEAGTVVLFTIGNGVRVRWPGGETTVWMASPFDMGALLLWRSGPWRDWWIDDAIVLGGMLQAQWWTGAEAVVLHEVDGRIHVRYLDIPSEAVATYEHLKEKWLTGGEDHPPRWNRRSPRARMGCPRCPVRQRCESLDRETGQTQDWE